MYLTFDPHTLIPNGLEHRKPEGSHIEIGLEESKKFSHDPSKLVNYIVDTVKMQLVRRLLPSAGHAERFARIPRLWDEDEKYDVCLAFKKCSGEGMYLLSLILNDPALYPSTFTFHLCRDNDPDSFIATIHFTPSGKDSLSGIISNLDIKRVCVFGKVEFKELKYGWKVD